MKSMPKWLLVPPAVAFLLVLGPLSMQTGASAAPTTTPATQQPQAPAPSEPAPASPRTARPSIAAPRSPDLLQMGSALAGVLLLGVGGVVLLRKLRGGATPTRGSTLATLRQTLRLSARQAVHAIEFDDRILLVGEHERGLVLLDSGKLPERAADEAEVIARALPTPTAHHDEEEELEGATPRNLVIPRPANPAPTRLPKPPAVPTGPRPTPGLNDFRNLLKKAGHA
jgi:flagellar biogenesis protein FliO